jgi:hypothetical protein
MADWTYNSSKQDDGDLQMHGDEDEEEGMISQEDCWSVIQSYFDENVLTPISPS